MALASRDGGMDAAPACPVSAQRRRPRCAQRTSAIHPTETIWAGVADGCFGASSENPRSWCQGSDSGRTLPLAWDLASRPTSL